MPHVIQNLGLRQHHFFVLHEVAQQIELGGGKLDELTGLGDLMGVIIKRQICVAHGGVVGGFFRRTTAAHDDTQAGNDLFQAKWLGHIIIRTDGQAVDALVHPILCREVQHRAVQPLLTQLS